MVTGEQTYLFRLSTLKKGLELELKGMKVSRGQTCYSIIKQEFGLKGTRKFVLAQFSEICNATKWYMDQGYDYEFSVTRGIQDIQAAVEKLKAERKANK